MPFVIAANLQGTKLLKNVYSTRYNKRECSSTFRFNLLEDRQALLN